MPAFWRYDKDSQSASLGLESWNAAAAPATPINFDNGCGWPVKLAQKRDRSFATVDRCDFV
jgi:hypothetical protein